MTEPDPLPPPPFPRTHYFAFDVLVRRSYLDIYDIIHVLQKTFKRIKQLNGRYRLWGIIFQKKMWLTVITLEDGETVHNAYKSDPP
ncbi:MAG: hypothetical protein WCF85_11505 [Rhodospirillaceae bacterium]